MPVKSDAPVLPGARAVARHVRISPNKARRVINLVRGLPAKEALTVLQFAPQAASEQVYKVLASAIANAENNERLQAFCSVTFDNDTCFARHMLLRDVNNLTLSLGRFAPELLSTHYAEEMWALYEAGELRPDSELTGEFEFDGFGTNPGALRMFAYVPEALPRASALVVVLHGCTQNAAVYDHGSGWSTLADRHGFVLRQEEALDAAVEVPVEVGAGEVGTVLGTSARVLGGDPDVALTGQHHVDLVGVVLPTR